MSAIEPGLDLDGLEVIARQMMGSHSELVKTRNELQLALDERDAALLEVERLQNALADVEAQLAEVHNILAPVPRVIETTAR